MSDNVVKFTGDMMGDVPEEFVLDRAKDLGVLDVVVVGIHPGGGLYLDSAVADATVVHTMLHLASTHVIEQIQDRIEGRDHE